MTSEVRTVSRMSYCEVTDMSQSVTREYSERYSGVVAPARGRLQSPSSQVISSRNGVTNGGTNGTPSRPVPSRPDPAYKVVPWSPIHDPSLFARATTTSLTTDGAHRWMSGSAASNKSGII